jgi:hypothetical protein
VPGILADANVEGHVSALLRFLQADPWKELWDGIGLSVETFESLGLPGSLSDAELYAACRQNDLVLITANRNRAGPDSLEATIEAQRSANALPVITLANPGEVLRDQAYASLVAEKLLEIVFDIEPFRGVGRIYVP